MKAIVSLCALMLMGSAWWIHQSLENLKEPIGPAAFQEADGQHINLKVDKGQSFKGVVQRLMELEVIANGLVFEMYGRYLGVDRLIKAGEYEVRPKHTPIALLELLKKGTLPPRLKITFPEGLNRWEMASRIESSTLADPDEFLERVEADELEGRLFPDTYWFRRDAKLDDVVKTLHDRFHEVLEEVLTETGSKARFTAGSKERKALLILASLIEKEGTSVDDRHKISRVFHNRIAKGMKLQSDPTCIYHPSLYQRAPHPSNCKDPTNRYSTYVIAGLPPTPIANVGRSALKAAIEPYAGPGAEKLFYFVAKRDGSGEHYFSKTLKEHGNAVNRYLRKKRAP